MRTTYVTSIALLALAGSVAGAQTRVSVSPESKLWVEGTSNLHDWSCKATALDATIEVDPSAVQVSTASPKLLKGVRVKVPVKSLKCGHGGMDDNVYKALKADGSPAISYIMANFQVASVDAKDFTLHTVGSLAMAGEEKQITVDVTAVRLPDGTVKATGTVPVKMTDFGITPPTAIFGRLKTGDEVKVKFELTVGPKAIAALTEQH